MAKVAFSKLDLKLNESVKKVSYCNSKNEEITYEVKCYLPIAEKTELISTIINKSIDDNGYYNPLRLKIFTTIEIVQAYTNLSFTEKQKENYLKLYDLLISNNIFNDVVNCLSAEEYEAINNDIKTTIDNIYKYKNSAMGIFETITADYSNLDLDITNLSSKLAGSDNVEFLKEVMTKLG